MKCALPSSSTGTVPNTLRASATTESPAVGDPHAGVVRRPARGHRHRQHLEHPQELRSACPRGQGLAVVDIDHGEGALGRLLDRASAAAACRPAVQPECRRLWLRRRPAGAAAACAAAAAGSGSGRRSPGRGRSAPCCRSVQPGRCRSCPGRRARRCGSSGHARRRRRTGSSPRSAARPCRRPRAPPWLSGKPTSGVIRFTGAMRVVVRHARVDQHQRAEGLAVVRGGRGHVTSASRGSRGRRAPCRAASCRGAKLPCTARESRPSSVVIQGRWAVQP